MANAPKYKKVEALFLGIISPLILAGYTALLVIQSEAVFWGRNTTIIYSGPEAYLVSLLWFGISALMLGHFLLRPYKMLSQSSFRVFMWVSATLVVLGLGSAVALV